MRSPRRYPRATRPRATARAARSISPWVHSRGADGVGEVDEGDLLGIGGRVEEVAEIVARAHTRVGTVAAYRLKSSGVATAARHAAPTYGASCPASAQA